MQDAQQQEDGAATVEQPVAVLRDEIGSEAVAAAATDNAPGEEPTTESQSVCSVVVRPDGNSIATGCNDRLVSDVSCVSQGGS